MVWLHVRAASWSGKKPTNRLNLSPTALIFPTKGFTNATQTGKT
jgi:hypothetical protein